MGEAVPGVADAAVYLHGGLADRLGGALAVDLRDPGRLQRRRRRQGVHRPGRVAQHAYTALDQGQPFGQRVRHGLVGPDRLPVLTADLGVAAGQRVRAARRPEQVRGRDDQGESVPALGALGGQLTRGRERFRQRGAGPGQVCAAGGCSGVAGQQPVPVQGQDPLDPPGVHGLVVDGDRDQRVICRQARGAAQVVGEDRAKERHVGQAPAELLGHERDLDPGGAVGPQRAPACRRDRLFQAGHALGVGQAGHRIRPKVADQPGRRVTQYLLFSGQTRVHSAP